MNVSDLTQSLSDYSPKVNEAVSSIVTALTPLAYVMIAVFFLIELDSWYKYMKQEGGGVTMGLWLEISLKYLIALVLVKFSSQICDAIFELLSMAVKLVEKQLPHQEMGVIVGNVKVKGWILSGIVSTVAKLTDYVAMVSINIITFMRYIQLYLLKALAPLLVATFVADTTREITKTFFKYYAGAVLQALVLIVVVRLYPALVVDDMFKADLKGDWATAFASIAKGIAFIFLIFGSQRYANKLLGLMG